MWVKAGCIFKLDDADWRTNHTQVPTPYIMDKKIRVFYACRTTSNKSFPAYFDLDRKTLEVINVHEKPIMQLGKPGFFDADGVMPSCAIEDKLYYIGWSELKNTARYQNEIGVADLNGNRLFTGPIIGRSPYEPGLAVMPFVMHQNSYRCYYQSLTSWEKVGDQYEPIYVIKYAESTDGIKWKRNPTVCVKPNYPLEAFSRPSLIYKDDKYHMFYCYRGSEDYRGGSGSYRIGYATSHNGINFERKDELAGIDVGVAGEFDSDMVCYPYIIEVDGRLLMFYNGNDFGQTGVGLAQWIN